MTKIKNQIVFFVDFLLKNGRLNIAILIKKNDEKIAWYFKSLIENIEKKYLLFQIFDDKYLYLFYRKNKLEKWQYKLTNLENIENLIEPPKTINDEIELKLEKL